MAEIEPALYVQVNGSRYTMDDLSFRESREVRQVVRDLLDDPTADLDDLALMDVIPAIVYVVARRDNPDFTLEQALDLKPADTIHSEAATKGAARPTRASATSGRRK